MKKTKKKSIAKKILLSCLVVALVIGLSYLGYYLIRYTFYDDYKDDYRPITYAEGTKFKALSDSSRPDGLNEEYVLAAESDDLKLYYNETTTEVAVYDKNSDSIKYSNPQDIDESDYINKVYFNKMKSQLVVYYYARSGATALAEMSSYEFCTNIEYKDDSEKREPQYSVEAIPNGIRVTYVIGDMSSETGTIATYITEDTFKDVKKKLEEYDKENGTKNTGEFSNRYAEAKDKDGFYKLNDGVKKRQMQQLQEVLELVGWTAEDYEREMDASGVEYTLPTTFSIPLEYTIIDDKLQVNISTDHIVEEGSGSLISVDVLPYFDATYHKYSTDNLAAYEQKIDDTATVAVAYEEVSDYITVTYDGNSTTATVDNSIAGDVSFANFTVYETSVDEEGNTVQGALLNNWNTGFGNNSFEVEEGKEYIMSVSSFKLGETLVDEVKFSIKPEQLPAEGYFLVPNGSGSLIYLNNDQCDTANAYSEKIYGQDDVMFESDTKVQETIASKLPVYGRTTNDSSMFVILSRGESLAEIRVQTANDETCKRSDALTNFNTAYCRYYLRAENEVEMSSTDKFVVWTEELFKTQITQLYCFLDDEHQGYSGMANYYRDYLVENGELVKSEETASENIGMYLDLIGAVKGDDSFLGFTYQAVIPLTTFKQAEEIANAFYANNVNNLIVNYQGWMNDGYYHNTVEEISVIGKLGGKGDFSDFTNLVEGKGGKVYADMAISQVTYSAEDFPYTTESSRIFGSGYIASYGKTSPITYSNGAALGYISNLYDILSPKYLSRYVDSALEETEGLNISGISYRDLGSVLYSDMKKTSIVHREQSKEIVLAQLEKIAATGDNVLMNAPYTYAFAVCDDIINAPIGDNNYISVDCEVPFYEMVIHGYINYTGGAINLSSETNVLENILQCVEYGASPHFTFTYVPATEMKYTALNNMYATNYTNWVDDATEIYNEVNKVLSKVSDANIVGHEILDDNNLVKKVTYSNGVVIYINYSDEDFSAEDVSVSAKSISMEVAK